MYEVRIRAGYDIKTLRERLGMNAYDAIMILKEVEHLAPQNFFYTHFSIYPYDFKRQPKRDI